MSARSSMTPWSARGSSGWRTRGQLAKRGRRVVVFERGARAAGRLGPELRHALADRPAGRSAPPPGAAEPARSGTRCSAQAGLWHEPVRLAPPGLSRRRGAGARASSPTGPARGLRGRAARPAAGRRACARRSDAEGLRGRALEPVGDLCRSRVRSSPASPGWLDRSTSASGSSSAPRWAPSTGRRCRAAGGLWTADRLWVCDGDDFQTLYPESLPRRGPASAASSR